MELWATQPSERLVQGPLALNLGPSPNIAKNTRYIACCVGFLPLSFFSSCSCYQLFSDLCQNSRPCLLLSCPSATHSFISMKSVNTTRFFITASLFRGAWQNVTYIFGGSSARGRRGVRLHFFLQLFDALKMYLKFRGSLLPKLPLTAHMQSCSLIGQKTQRQGFQNIFENIYKKEFKTYAPTLLYSTLLYSTSTMLYYSLPYSTLLYPTMPYSTLLCSSLLHSSLLCSALPYAALLTSTSTLLFYTLLCPTLYPSLHSTLYSLFSTLYSLLSTLYSLLSRE